MSDLPRPGTVFDLRDDGFVRLGMVQRLVATEPVIVEDAGGQFYRVHRDGERWVSEFPVRFNVQRADWEEHA